MLRNAVIFHARNACAPCGSEMDFKGRNRCVRLVLLALLLVSLTGCGLTANRSGKSYVINGKRYHILASADGFKENGLASWYGEPFHGRKTASGEVYDMNQISAAHKTLPLHTWVEVKNLDNNKAMALRINDRGPFVKGRVIDLSRAAAQEIGMLNAGVARVSVKAISGSKAQRLVAAQQKGGSTGVVQQPAVQQPTAEVKVAETKKPTARERLKKRTSAGVTTITLPGAAASAGD